VLARRATHGDHAGKEPMHIETWIRARVHYPKDPRDLAEAPDSDDIFVGTARASSHHPRASQCRE